MSYQRVMSEFQIYRSVCQQHPGTEMGARVIHQTGQLESLARTPGNLFFFCQNGGTAPIKFSCLKARTWLERYLLDDGECLGSNPQGPLFQWDGTVYEWLLNNCNSPAPGDTGPGPQSPPEKT